MTSNHRTANSEFAYAELLRRSHPDHGVVAGCPACRTIAVRDAHAEWSKAKPGTAMAILAAAGSDMVDRRSILRAWGVSFDDMVDYSSDTFLRGCGYGPDGSSLTVAGWACTDCMMLVANGETPPELDETGEAEYLARFEAHTDGYHVAPGGAHDDDCTNDGSSDCYCETQDFSWSSCDTCGSSLGGARHAVTLFPRS